MKSMLLIVLGWMLGLLSPWLADTIQRPYKRSEVKRGIHLELKDLRTKLVAIVLQVSLYKGTLDQEMIRWARQRMETDPAVAKLVAPAPWELVSKLDNDNLNAASRALAPATMKLVFRRYSVPFLDSHLNALNWFSVDFQAAVHRIRSVLSVLNQEVEVTWFYFQKTFDASLTELNRNIIQNNYDGSHDFIGKAARQIIDEIEAVLEIKK